MAADHPKFDLMSSFDEGIPDRRNGGGGAKAAKASGGPVDDESKAHIRDVQPEPPSLSRGFLSQRDRPHKMKVEKARDEPQSSS
jgi:hypothetical protein